MDEGIGMQPELLNRVFDLFVQNRQGLDRSQGGWGSAWQWFVAWSRCTAAR